MIFFPYLKDKARSLVSVSKQSFIIVKERWYHRLFERKKPDFTNSVLIGKVTYNLYMLPDGRIAPCMEPFQVSEGRAKTPD